MIISCKPKVLAIAIAVIYALLIVFVVRLIRHAVDWWSNLSGGV